MTCQKAVDLMDNALEGGIPPALAPGFEEHMAECAPCATYLEHLRVTRIGLRHLRQEGGPNERRQELIEAFRREFRRDHE